jgi:hypothetical protein
LWEYLTDSIGFIIGQSVPTLKKKNFAKNEYGEASILRNCQPDSFVYITSLHSLEPKKNLVEQAANSKDKTHTHTQMKRANAS